MITPTNRCESGQCAAAHTLPDGSVDVWSTRRPGEVTHLDADELPVSAEVLALLGGQQASTSPARWRVGRSVGRTIYAQVGNEASKEDVLIGVMDTRELAALVVRAVNHLLAHAPKVGDDAI